MNVSAISLTSPAMVKKAPAFGSDGAEKQEYENPVSRSTEKNLAILGAVGGSAVLGGIVGGITAFILKNIESVNKGGKWAWIAGGIATAASLLFTLPSRIYHTKVNAFARQKEMDVFSRDKALKTDLTEAVHEEVNNPDVPLSQKLDDNFKLQMANRGAALGVANMTPQA